MAGNQSWQFIASRPSSDLNQSYAKIIKQYSSKNEQSFNQINDQLFEKYYQTHDPAIRDEIILRNIRLVFNQSKKILINDYAIDGDDIIQTGIVGLIDAVDTYKMPSSAVFSTYASVCIRNRLLMLVRKYKYVENQISIYTKLTDQENITIEDVIEDPSADFSDPMRFISVMQLLNEYSYLISDRNMEIIKYRFGIDGYDPHSGKEAAEYFGITQTHINSAVSKSLKKIREHVLDQI